MICRPPWQADSGPHHAKGRPRLPGNTMCVLWCALARIVSLLPMPSRVSGLNAMCRRGKLSRRLSLGHSLACVYEYVDRCRVEKAGPGGAAGRCMEQDRMLGGGERGRGKEEGKGRGERETVDIWASHRPVPQRLTFHAGILCRRFARYGRLGRRMSGGGKRAGPERKRERLGRRAQVVASVVGVSSSSEKCRDAFSSRWVDRGAARRGCV